MARPRLARRGSALERRLGAVLRDRALWEQALTHRSYAYERGGLPTNERLEFLGDAVLGIVVKSRQLGHPAVQIREQNALRIDARMLFGERDRDLARVGPLHFVFSLA